MCQTRCLQAGKVEEATAAFTQGANLTPAGKPNIAAMRVQVCPVLPCLPGS